MHIMRYNLQIPRRKKARFLQTPKGIDYNYIDLFFITELFDNIRVRMKRKHGGFTTCSVND